MTYTTIRITEDLRDALRSRGAKDETYDDIIRRLTGL